MVDIRRFFFPTAFVCLLLLLLLLLLCAITFLFTFLFYQDFAAEVISIEGLDTEEYELVCIRNIDVLAKW